MKDRILYNIPNIHVKCNIPHKYSIMQYIYMELYEPHIYAIIEFCNVSHAIVFNIQSGLKSLQLEKFLWWSVGGCERYSVRERGYKVGEGIPLSRPLCIGIYMRKFKQSSFRKPNVQVLRSKQASVSAYMYQGFLINFFQS